jgi:hypothetical protein
MGITNAALGHITTTLGTTFYIGVGTGTTAFAKSQTTLITEVAASGLTRAAATVTQQTTTVANDTLRCTKTFTASGSVSVGEFGVFTAASSGTMIARKVLDSVRAVVSGDTLSITHNTVLTLA